MSADEMVNRARYLALTIVCITGCQDRDNSRMGSRPAIAPVSTQRETKGPLDTPNDCAEKCLIYFKSESFDLDDARRVLGATKLTTTPRGDVLSVRWGKGPELLVRLFRGKEVKDEAEKLGNKTRYASRLAQCNSRIEITFNDLAQVLEESNTLIEVQLSLQAATKGVIYTSWNGQFIDE